MGFFNSSKAKAPEDPLAMMYADGRAGLERECERVNEITGRRLSKDQLAHIVLSANARVMVAGLDDSDADLARGVQMRSGQVVTEEQAREIYVYLTGEGQYLRRVVPMLQQQGIAVETAAEVRAVYRPGSQGDKVPNGSGEFAFAPTNPIPTICIRCSKRYLALLRYGGDPVDATRNGSMQSTVCNGSVDQYTLMQRGKNVGTIFISPYHKKTSSLAPRSFSLAEVP